MVDGSPETVVLDGGPRPAVRPVRAQEEAMLTAPGTAPTRPLGVGLVLPPSSLLPDGPFRWRDALALARRAEAVGFDAVWVADTLYYVIDGALTDSWEGGATLGAMAASTSRLRLGTWIVNSLYRNPALLAKMAATADDISGGRLILGLGGGSAYGDDPCRAYGYPTDHRYGRFEEALRIVVGLLRDGHADVAGRYYQARGCELRLPRSRPAGPPILIAATSRRMLRLAARHADAWTDFRTRYAGPADFAPTLAELDEACRDVGRAPATLPRTVGIPVAPPGFPVRPWAGWVPLGGSADELAAALRALADVGVAHVQLCLFPATPAAIEALAPVLAALDRGGPGGPSPGG
jgi:alkanesulfonate monooxygenase SsuD/methylene tetrahydromethanopterin reductase-like flavin-dependent oxidoreductase (luciferase family)